MDKYLVAIGSDSFELLTTDHQSAKYEAATEFKKKYSLRVPLGRIVAHAKARMVPNIPNTGETTEQVLESLKEDTAYA